MKVVLMLVPVAAIPVVGSASMALVPLVLPSCLPVVLRRLGVVDIVVEWREPYL